VPRQTGIGALVRSLGKDRSFLGQVNSATAFIAALSSSCLLPWMCRNFRFRDVTLLTAGILMFATASATLASYPTETGVLVTVPLFAVALSFLRSCPAAFLSKAAPMSMQGEAMGALDSASSVCRVFAPLVAGVLADKLGSSAPFGMCSFACLGGLVALRMNVGGVMASHVASSKSKAKEE